MLLHFRQEPHIELLPGDALPGRYERFCTEHVLPLDELSCPAGHEINPEFEDWWVMDTHTGQRVSIVRGFRVIWEDWYEDLTAPKMTGRKPDGFTPGAEKLRRVHVAGEPPGNATRSAAMKRSHERRRARKEGREIPEWAMIREKVYATEHAETVAKATKRWWSARRHRTAP